MPRAKVNRANPENPSLPVLSAPNPENLAPTGGIRPSAPGAPGPAGSPAGSPAGGNLLTGARDQFGFLESIPNITRQQFTWLTHRLDADTDEAADVATETDPLERARWLTDPAFKAIYDTCEENRREGFRLLGTQLLPLTLRRLYDILSTGTNKETLGAMTILLRTQALLVDRVPQASQDEVQALLSLLRERQSPTLQQAIVINTEAPRQ